MASSSAATTSVPLSSISTSTLVKGSSVNAVFMLQATGGHGHAHTACVLQGKVGAFGGKQEGFGHHLGGIAATGQVLALSQPAVPVLRLVLSPGTRTRHSDSVAVPMALAFSAATGRCRF